MVDQPSHKGSGGTQLDILSTKYNPTYLLLNICVSDTHDHVDMILFILQTSANVA